MTRPKKPALTLFGKKMTRMQDDSFCLRKPGIFVAIDEGSCDITIRRFAWYGREPSKVVSRAEKFLTTLRDRLCELTGTVAVAKEDVAEGYRAAETHTQQVRGRRG